MTKCEWGRCTAAARFTIRRLRDAPAVSRQTWHPRWCYDHALCMVRRKHRDRRAYTRKRFAHTDVEHILIERVTCQECGRRPWSNHAICGVTKRRVSVCRKRASIYSHGATLDSNVRAAPCPAYCRRCAALLHEESV